MKELLGENTHFSQEFPAEDFLGSALLFVESTLWKSGFEIIKREGITDSVFYSHPRVFSRVLSAQKPNNRPRHFDGKNTRSIYEAFLLDFFSLVKFEHQRQCDLERKAGIHHEGIEARSLKMLEGKVETEIIRARKIGGKLLKRSPPVITGRRSSHIISRTSAQIEKITRK